MLVRVDRQASSGIGLRSCIIAGIQKAERPQAESLRVRRNHVKHLPEPLISQGHVARHQFDAGVEDLDRGLARMPGVYIAENGAGFVQAPLAQQCESKIVSCGQAVMAALPQSHQAFFSRAIASCRQIHLRQKELDSRTRLRGRRQSMQHPYRFRMIARTQVQLNQIRRQLNVRWVYGQVLRQSIYRQHGTSMSAAHA